MTTFLSHAMKRALTSAALLSLSACAATGDTQLASTPEAAPEPVTIRVIGLNDFHGNLEPLSRPYRITETDGTRKEVHAAGVAHLASAVREYRAKDEYSLVIAAGDLIGGSPLASSIFLDEPSIGAMNRLGLDFNAVGNHEFDRGWRELLRIAEGGCAQFTQRTPCQVENPYEGAEFDFLAANVVKAEGDTLFPSYGMRRFGEGASAVDIAVIGLTLEDTPSLVTPSGVAGLEFRDEADTINALIPELEAKGADAIIVSIHQGLRTEVGYNDKSCGGVDGALLEVLARLDPKVDLVISGHTHRAYICDYGQIDPTRDFLVTSAAFAGTMLTDIALTIDPARGEVTNVTADNVIIQSTGDRVPMDTAYRQFPADPEIAAYVARYVAASQEVAQRPVGKLSGPTSKEGPVPHESTLGNLIADAQLAATHEASAQIAMMNDGGIRTSMEPAADGTVSYADIYAVQPFGNTLITKSFTGAQLMAVLEQQFPADDRPMILAVSDGFSFAFDASKPAGSRIVSASLNGQPIDPITTYRVTMNSFLSSGGDGFTAFAAGADAITGPVDLDAMEAWLTAVSVRNLPQLGRITNLSD